MNKFLYTAFVITLLTVASNILAQNTPGGISNGLVLWLDASNLSGLEDGDLVNHWPDASSFNNDGQGGKLVNPQNSQIPTYVSANPNLGGRPAVRFNGNGNIITVPNSSSFNDMQGIDAIIVHRTGSSINNPFGFIGKRTNQNTSSNYAFVFFVFTGGQHFADINGNGTNNRRNTSNFQIVANSNYISEYTFSGSANNNDKIRIYDRGNLTTMNNANVTPTSINNSVEPITIGDLDQNRNAFYRGDIAEIILYNRRLNNAERAVIMNYLAGKYTTILLDQNYYNHIITHPENVVGIGNFDNDIIESNKGSNLLEVSAVESPSLNSWIFWGENDIAVDEINTSDVRIPDGVESRLEKTWRFTKEGNPPNVNLKFSLPNVALTSGTEMFLMIKRGAANFEDSTFEPIPLSNDKTNNESSEKNGFNKNNIEIDISDFELEDGDEVTIGFNNPNPLPVKLISFSGRITDTKNGNAILNWQTASEVNNAYFEVESSLNGSTFKFIDIVNGAGTTSAQTSYQYNLNGIFKDTYFRLKQVDFDGNYEYFGPILISVEPSRSSDFRLLQNPISRNTAILLLSNANTFEYFSVSTLRGEILAQFKVEPQQQEGQIMINLPLSNLNLKPNELYLLSRQTPGMQTQTVKFLVQP
jgi:hypothetical protein